MGVRVFGPLHKSIYVHPYHRPLGIPYGSADPGRVTIKGSPAYSLGGRNGPGEPALKSTTPSPNTYLPSTKAVQKVGIGRQWLTQRCGAGLVANLVAPSDCLQIVCRPPLYFCAFVAAARASVRLQIGSPKCWTMTVKQGALILILHQS